MLKLKIKDNKKLLKGFYAVADAVGQTLGSEGGYAISHNDFGNPDITKDGISVAKKIFFDDKYENIGATLAKQVCATTLAKAQDATSTSIVLAKAITEQMAERFNKKVQKGVEEAYDEVLVHLKALSKKVDDKSALKIATVSANNNKELGQLVFEAYKIVGENGIINVNQHDKEISELKEYKGMKLDKGFMNPYFITNEKTASFEAEDVQVLIYEGHLDNDLAVKNFLQANSNSSILIVAERFSDDVILNLVDFHQRKTLNICCVQAPNYDVKRKAILEDLALYTGGEVFLQGSGENIVAGVAKKVTVNEAHTAIIVDATPEKALERISNLKEQLKTVIDKEFIKSRIQALEGASATIYVGGTTPVEKKEKFDLVEDAVGAILSSMKEGWVCGGGASFVHISNIMLQTFDNEDVQFGYDVLRKAIKAPFIQICENANRKAKNYLVEIDKYGLGYNAVTDEISNLIEDGIIDSKYSIRVALENAKSIAVLLSNVKVVIAT